MAIPVLANMALTGGAKLTGVPTPTDPSDAVSKAYVDAVAGLTSQVTLSVATLSYGYAEVVQADAAVSSASKLTAAFAAELDAENDLESLADDQMQIWPVPEAGQVRFVLTSNGPIFGPFKVNYRVAA
jgi:hypothetical protein